MKTFENTVNTTNNQLLVVKNTSLLLNNYTKVVAKTGVILGKAVLAATVLTLVNMII